MPGAYQGAQRTFFLIAMQEYAGKVKIGVGTVWFVFYGVHGGDERILRQILQ